MTHAERLNPDQLLKHLPDYGVVICRACKFAVQPQALASHLLRHQIYRDERRRILDRFSVLGLYEPDDVSQPDPNGPPVPDLPLYQGYICIAPGCSHSCVSQKRMFQHWSEAHGEPDSKNVRSRPAALQTFFRGNKIRYFEVDGSYQLLTPEAGSSTQPTSMRSPAGFQRLITTPPNFSDESESPYDAPPDLDMQALRYFWHYTLSPHLIPHRGENGARRFWTETVYHEAFKHQFLMFGILGIAAAHLAAGAPDRDSCQAHRDCALQYQSAGTAVFWGAAKVPDVTNSTALIAYTRYSCVQRFMLQHIDDKQAFSVANQRSINDLIYVTEVFSMLRRGVELLFRLQYLLPHGSEFILGREETEGILPMEELETMEQVAMHSLHIPPAFSQGLDILPQRLYQLRALQDTNELQAVTQAKSALVVSAARTYAAEDLPALWSGVEKFVQLVPDSFVRILEAYRPAALVIFAHWCPLLFRLEAHHFFLHGQSARLLRIIRANLSPELAALVANVEYVI